MANNGMFRGKVSRTRAVLVAISTTLLIIYAVDFVLAGPLLRRAHRASSPPEFTLQLWGQEDAVYTADVGASLPMFEPKAGWWMLGADHLNDLSGHLRGLEIGPDGSHPSLIVRLPADATVGVYRRAIASLADQGICHVGVYAPAPAKEDLAPEANPDWPPEGFVSVYRVLRVKSGHGVVRPCEDRYPPRPPVRRTSANQKLPATAR